MGRGRSVRMKKARRGIHVFTAAVFETITINQCGRLLRGGRIPGRHTPFSPPKKLTLHRDLDGAVFLAHVIARRAPVDSCAVHGEIPQGHKLRVLEIWEESKEITNLCRLYIVCAFPHVYPQRRLHLQDLRDRLKCISCFMVVEREMAGRSVREREMLMECLFKNEARHTEEDLRRVAGACLRERWSPTAPWDM